jgi:hypothetical protein
LPVVSKYVGEKRERKISTLHAFLYKTVNEVIQQQNTYELNSSVVWETIKDKHGSPIPSKPQSFESVEYRMISHKDITTILVEVFGATRPEDMEKAGS